VLNLLGGAAPLLRRDGRTAEGRIAEDRLILPQSAWVALPRPNTVAGPDSPIRVSVSGIGCEEGVDYEIQPGRTAYPFRATDFPWKIRRVPGGAIPDGATVDVRYAYVPENTAAMCPYAKATLRLWRGALEKVRDRLKPRTIHLGLSRPARLRADLRCEARASSDLDAFAHAVKSAIGISSGA
ncbi:MAG: hypothetical protein IIC21_08845, partial [Chloroflexi bacterium]|nr:hypothetical protein [Chloroflexota bacterium]